MDLVPILEKNISTSFGISIIVSYIGGVLTSFSPCIYPVVPIISGFVSSNCVGEKTKKKAFFLSLFYVIGMSVVYSLLGIFSALTGTLFGKLANNPWVLIAVANIIIFMALASMDIISLPGINLDMKTSGKGLLGSLILGASSAFIISPCALPVMGVILMYVATKQSIVSGGFLLFFFSLGMGTLLILVGTFSGLVTSLPRPGKWMLIIKRILGIVMIILAEYFLVKAGMMIY